jgi:hypothetical protein
MVKSTVTKQTPCNAADGHGVSLVTRNPFVDLFRQGELIGKSCVSLSRIMAQVCLRCDRACCRLIGVIYFRYDRGNATMQDQSQRENTMSFILVQTIRRVITIHPVFLC